MRLVINYTLFAALLLLAGCAGTGGAGTEQTTANGFRMQFIDDKAGDPVKEGDVILYGMTQYLRDSAIMSTPTQPYLPEFKIKSPEAMKAMGNAVVDAFAMMSKGDTAVVYLPADSLKGNRLGLKSGEFLVFGLSIKDVMDTEAYAGYTQERDQKMQAERAKVQERQEEVATLVAETLDTYKKNGFGDLLVKDPSGLEYVIHEKGNGPMPKVGQQVNVHYYGVLKSDGSMFDNSFQRGQNFNFRLGVGQVIAGWDKGLALLPAGTKATLFIPSDMAYGATDRPGIPANSDLVFYVETI